MIVDFSAPKKEKCQVCNTQAMVAKTFQYDSFLFYTCPTCGRFEIELGTFSQFNINHLGSYLFYHRFSESNNPAEYRYHTVLDKRVCDAYKKEYDDGKTRNGYPIHMDSDVVENWYPKSFAERTDLILLYLGKHIQHIGQFIGFSMQEAFGLLFIDRNEKSNNPGTKGHVVDRKREDCLEEAKYMLDYLKSISLIDYAFGSTEEKYVHLQLTPSGYSRVDELQKNTGHGKNVLVAMRFGDETKALREAIRIGIQTAGYIAIFIDEVQHNDFITPELLKHIRDSKFVVVDLTHQNNGAYFEEGYAMGIGKQVIQLCRNDVKLHFDIAQKNTIMWETEAEIPERLKNRIIATID